MAAVAAIFSFYFFIKKDEGKDWVYGIYFLIVLITGTVLFSLGLSYKNDSDTSFSVFFIVAKSISSALKSFGGDFNATATARLAEANPIYAAAVLSHYMAAIILTFLIVIKLFGKNAINRIHVFVNSVRSGYIVVGAGGQAEIFLGSFERKKRKRTTIILEAGQKYRKKDLMFKGFAVVVIKEGGEGQAKRKNTGRMDIDRETLEALKIAGFHHKKSETKIISMSENDVLNLLVARIVTEYITSIVNPSKNENGRINRLSPDQESKLETLNLSAYIMYEMLDRAEHFAFTEYALGRVRFFNPYEVCARKFMLENPVTSLIPEFWINREKARLYNAADDEHREYRIGNIFIGCGYTNQHILKKSICNYQLLGTDYNALVVDKDAKKLEKQFQNSAPGLFSEKDENGKKKYGSELKPDPDGSVYYPNPEENYNIVFADLNALTSDFYNRIAQEIAGTGGDAAMDFVSVVISLGDDKLSIETALELRQKLYERRLLKGKTDGNEYERVRIFVKIVKESVLTDHNLLNDKNDIDSEIVVFGALDEILNEDHIIHEKLDSIAKRIANDYWKNAGCDGQKTNIVTKWDTLTEFKRDSNRYAAMSIRAKLNLLGFELMEGTKGTDRGIVEAYKVAYDIAVSEKQRVEKESGKFVDFAERDDSGNILDNARNNLARLEHQRWNTLHLASGWTKLTKDEVTADTRQDEKARQHACITTFEGLSELRQKQADAAIAENKQPSVDKALSDADTVCYDFDLMDRLFDTLEGSKYYVDRYKPSGFL
jgi:hypothetical protein